MNEFEEMEDQKITATINGEEKECDVLFTYDADELDETIIGYTDNTNDQEGKLNIFVSKYTKFNPNEMTAVTDPDELSLVNDVINEIQAHYR